ncbi:hypothetical protein RND81_09G090800 [Saponaria officinalis]|uniref:SWIM-type domain-containing protein n=1 Tax=Saponaria officinalis TaxID=3572 RepID=A0AAW1IJR8_SAPOF
MMFLKGNKNMTSVQKNFVAKAARYNNVGASENDFKNFVRDMKKKCEKIFYFNFQVDDNNRLCRVFWTDTINIKNYLLFGDMMSVDSTYRTNKYNMVFVPFTGVDHQKRCVNFGAGLLAHEDIDSFEWLFNSFLEAMEGHQPKVIITDQDPAMKTAIAEIFTEASHRLCMLKLNHDNKQTHAPLKTPLPLEKHGAETYTHNIFKDFQSELCAALYNCGMDDLRKNNDTEVYTISDIKRGGKSWKVTYKPSIEENTCSCCLYQRMGLLCRHVLWMLKTKKITRISEKYIVHRWSKDAMNKPVFDKDGNILGEGEIFNDKRITTTEIWEEVYSCVTPVEETMTMCNNLYKNLRSSINIHAPKRSQNKGSGKRIQLQVINALEKSAKKSRYRRNCGQQGHDTRNCKASKD